MFSPGPFHLRVAKKASLVNIDALSEEARNDLLGHASFDRMKHEIYQVSIAVEFDFPGLAERSEHKMPRKIKKVSYDKVDKIFIKTHPLSERVEFLGIYPASRSIEGRSVEFEFSPEIGFGVSATKISFAGKIKTLLSRRKHAIMAARTESFAQWIFLKPWLNEAHTVMDLDILCTVPKDLDPALRFLRFDAVALNGGRALATAENRRVWIPDSDGPHQEWVRPPGGNLALVPAA